MTTNDGGPAFPCGYHRDGNSADQAGMTLRDWFAGTVRHEDLKLPVNSLDCADFLGVPYEEYHTGENTWLRVVCKARYAYADAMLRERER